MGTGGQLLGHSGFSSEEVARELARSVVHMHSSQTAPLLGWGGGGSGGGPDSLVQKPKGSQGELDCLPRWSKGQINRPVESRRWGWRDTELKTCG